MMKLYHYFRSSTSYRVRIALHLKGLNFEERPINLLKSEQRSAEYLSINPLGGVPSLQDGDVTLSQSLAIIEYLEGIKPTPALYPADPKLRALSLQIASIITEDIHPLINMRTQKYLADHFGADDTAKQKWMRHWMNEGMRALESLIERSGVSGACSIGNTPSLADICLIPHLYSMRRFNIALDDYPRCTAIEKHCIGLPAFIAAAPESQSDAPEDLAPIHGRKSALRA